jgi:hypothetical protein
VTRDGGVNVLIAQFASVADFFWQRASMKGGNHCEIDEFHIAFCPPKQKDAAFRLDRDMVTMRHTDLAAIRQMQSERIRLSGILAK